MHAACRNSSRGFPDLDVSASIVGTRDRDSRAPAEAQPGRTSAGRRRQPPPADAAAADPAARQRPQPRQRRPPCRPPAAAPAAPVGPPPPKPDIPVVAAAKARKKIPFWAFATLSTLPLWAFMYVRALTPADRADPRPARRRRRRSTAAAPRCHGSNGEGGVGYQFSQGEVLKTFPHIEDQLRWVYSGSEPTRPQASQVYGDPKRPGGAHITRHRARCPAGREVGGQLTEAQILAVVCHERFTLGGADPTAPNQTEFDNWCADRFAGVDRRSKTARPPSTTSTPKVPGCDQGRHGARRPAPLPAAE